MARSLRRWDPHRKLYLLTPRRSSELSTGVDWTEVAAGPDPIVALASRLLAELQPDPSDQHHDRGHDPCQDQAHDHLHARTYPGPVAVVIERADDLAGSVAEPALSSLIKACVDNGHFVVAEADTSFFSSNFGLQGLLKSSRSGLALQPDGIEGPTVFRASFPALNQADLPEGRGFLVQRGRPELLQVALAGDPDPEGGRGDLAASPGECSPSTAFASAPSFAVSGVGKSVEGKWE